MEEVNFDEWWRDFLRDPGQQDPYEAAQRLSRYMEGLPLAKHRDFQHELVRVVSDRAAGWGLAAEALVDVDPETLEPLRDHLPCDAGFALNDYSASILRALARRRDKSLVHVVESILLASPTSSPWTSVPWALWPHAPDSFARVWSRYFREEPPPRWVSTAIVQAFLREHEALRAVRNTLEKQSAHRWTLLRDAIRAQLASPWLSSDGRAKIEDVCRGTD